MSTTHDPTAETPMISVPNDEGYFFDAVVRHPVTVV